jgi:hypothetical protein
MPYDPAVVDEWLWRRLTQDPAVAAQVNGRIYPDLAPSGATYPFVVVSQMSGRDRIGLGGARVLHEGVWSVRVVGSGPGFGALVPIAAAVDAALHGQSEQTATGDVYECVREEAVRLPPAPDLGVLSYQIVQLYRVRCRAAG